MFISIPSLWSFLKPKRKRQFGLLALVMVIASFSEVLSIGAVLPFLGTLAAPEALFKHALVQPFIQALNLTRPQELILPFTIVFILAVIFSCAMRVLLLWLQTSISYSIGADLSNEIYERALYQPYEAHLFQNSSQLIDGITNKVGAVVANIILPILIILSSTLMLTGLVGVMIAIDPLIVLFSFGGFGFIYFIISVTTKKQLATNSQKISLNSVKAVKALQEGLGGIRDVLIDGSQKTFCAIYRHADFSFRRAQASNLIIAGAPRFLIEALGMVLISVFAYAVSIRDGDFSQAIPILGMIALGAQRILPVMQQLYSSFSNLKGSQDSLNDVIALLSKQIPYRANEEALAPMKFENSFKLDKVFYSYFHQGPQVLNNISFEIKKGSRVGFMGTTGSGKSTLLDIIMGLLLPTSGTLEVDGKQITYKNYRAWQARIAHVPQAIFLADASIAENIAFGVPIERIDMQRVKTAAQKAQIDNIVDSLDNKYLTLIGERGIRLSGGQRQRIGIARALYRNAEVLIFDEATSALDGDTELAVMQAINTLNSDVTVLIVAHRLSTLAGCDYIYEVINGNLVLSTLLEANGLS